MKKQQSISKNEDVIDELYLKNHGLYRNDMGLVCSNKPVTGSQMFSPVKTKRSKSSKRH